MDYSTKWSFVMTLIPIMYILSAVYSQKDMSADGTPSQSSTYIHYVANLAISGGPTNQFESGSCSHTAHKLQYCWWMLSFTNPTTYITKVVTMFRAGSAGRFAGFSLYVTNSTISSSAKNPPSGHLCYHHEGPDVPALNETINCYRMGRYVIIYNERKNDVSYPAKYSPQAILEFCDVNVFGCEKKMSGVACNVPCPENCIDQHCFPSNSSCVWGCKNGTGGPACDKNNLAWYGIATQNPANDSRQANLVIDGNKNYYACAYTSSPQAWLQVDLGGASVVYAIYINFRPSDAVKTLSGGHSVYFTNTSGTWTDSDLLYKAPNPNNNFPITIHQMDPPVTGQYVIYVPLAVNGIAYVDVCEFEVTGCLVGFYGDMCNHSCPVHCHGNCDLSTGDCIHGCESGWNGTTCDQECPSGTFGRNCIYNCYCLTSPCNTTSGKCISDECDKGWTGPHCNQECLDHRFGYNCNDTCHCLYSTCDRFDGVCHSSQCQNGWQLDSCSKECDSGTYGEDCINACGKCINDDNCDVHNGVCWNGCQKGWTGIQCFNESKTTNTASMSDSDDNNAIYSSVSTFFITVLLCVIVFLIMLWYRRHKSNSSQNKGDTNGRHIEQELYSEGVCPDEKGGTNDGYDDIQITSESHYSTLSETLKTDASSTTKV